MLLRKSRENRERARRCNRGRKPQNVTVQLGWEGAVSSMIRKPEDLPERLFGNLADRVLISKRLRIKKRCRRCPATVGGIRST